MSVDDLLQLSASGVIAGSAYALNGVAFALIWNVTQRFHFAFAFTYALSAYMGAVASHAAGFWPAVVAGALAGAVVGGLVEYLVYRPLAARSEGSALLTVFIAALGLNIAGENLLRLIWIDAPTQQISGVEFSPLTFGSVHLTSFDVEFVAVSWVLIAVVAGVLAFTSWGRNVRATQANAEMAEILGLGTRLIFTAVFATGSLLAGVAAVFAGAKTAVTPEMGFQPMFYAFVVAFLGGPRGSTLYVALLGITVGLLENWSTLFIGSEWTPLVVFGLLLVYAAQKAVDVTAVRRVFARSA